MGENNYCFSSKNQRVSHHLLYHDFSFFENTLVDSFKKPFFSYVMKGIFLFFSSSLCERVFSQSSESKIHSSIEESKIPESYKRRKRIKRIRHFISSTLEIQSHLHPGQYNFFPQFGAFLHLLLETMNQYQEVHPMLSLLL